jgi:hypothetical protein
MRTPPPGTALSPDGAYWWDGSAWQPVDGPDTYPGNVSSPAASDREGIRLGLIPTPPSTSWPVHAAPAEVKQPGFFERRRIAKAAKAHKAAVVEWEASLTEARGLLDLVENFTGLTSAEGIILKSHETVYGRLDGAALMEERVTGGHWESRNQGVSIPVGRIGGRSIRYHVGQSRGHYVKGQPTPTAIDRGVAFITSQRVLFTGTRQTRECLYAKLVGYQHGAGVTAFSVSNRQKPTVIHYGADMQGWFIARFALALAQLVEEVRGVVADIEAHRPSLSLPQH